MIQKEVDAVNGGGKVEALHLDLASLRWERTFLQNRSSECIEYCLTDTAPA